MQAFTAAKTKVMMTKLGGAIAYTPPGGSAISSVAIVNPNSQILSENGIEVVAIGTTIVLTKVDITDRPARNATIVYTDPDTAAVTMYQVDNIVDRDTHTWTVVVSKVVT